MLIGAIARGETVLGSKVKDTERRQWYGYELMNTYEL